MPGRHEDVKKWPPTVPTMTGATTEEEKRLVGKALAKFALALIEPSHVDWIQVFVVPNPRDLVPEG